jgi:hypothetical protein
MNFVQYSIIEAACRSEAIRQRKRLSVSSTNSAGRIRFTLYDVNGETIRREATGNRPTAQEKYDVLRRVAGEVFDAVSNAPSGPDTY